MDTFMKDIKKNSDVLHDVAEKTGFLRDLLDGNITRESYSEYLFNLYEVYKTIEFNLEKYSDNEIVKEFAIKEVYRSEQIYRDLRFLLGEKVKSMKMLASTKAYIERINELGRENPELLVAHAYTRYLADLFGGRTIYAMLKEAYKIEEDGLNYYVYDSLDEGESMRAFIMNYHNKLNNINLNEKLKEKFIDEVSNSYVYNIAISNELIFSKK
ncbi:biliverdin-producing heme oxygenase [Clostridium sp. Ade.TY]|uniref:biliverdin-producing heme oxygenase n=1 Tax=Clostridium sp. Ade.TY TaxID=1391647 RepID=UPI00041AB031|nr:biliverdin-producing heme oxygenase [Clostridium sp. Ade.TY]